MIYFINNAYSSDLNICKKEILEYIFKDNQNIKTTNFYSGGLIQYDINDTKKDIESHIQKIKNINYENLCIFLTYSKQCIPIFTSYYGEKNVRFYNIVRNLKDLYIVFDAKKYAVPSIYGCFDLYQNGNELVSEQNVTTYKFIDIIHKRFSDVEKKINNVEDYEKYKNRFNINLWQKVRDGFLTTEQAFENVVKI